MTCSRLPKHWRASWTVWVRVRPDYWQCSFATNDPIRAEENAADRALDTLVMPPGESPLMPKSRCHRPSP